GPFAASLELASGRNGGKFVRPNRPWGADLCPCTYEATSLRTPAAPTSMFTSSNCAAACWVACLEHALSSSKAGSASNRSMRTRSRSSQRARHCAAYRHAKDRAAYLTGRDHHDIHGVLVLNLWRTGYATRPHRLPLLRNT